MFLPKPIDMLSFEKELWRKGYRYVAGVDEVGRGPLAGPVVAAAVIIPIGSDLSGITDSKQLSAPQRKEAYARILALCLTGGFVGIGIAAVSAKAIDRIGILNASLLAMRRAVAKLSPAADYVLVDGLFVPKGLSVAAQAIVKGDNLSRSIAAASIIAKVTRDRLMTKLDPRYPQYNFARNKGYGSPEHRNAIMKYGGTAHHRASFSPLKDAQITLSLGKDNDFPYV